MNQRERALELAREMTPKEKATQPYAVRVKIGEDWSLVSRDASGGVYKNATGNVREVLRDGIGQVTRPLGTRPAGGSGRTAPHDIGHARPPTPLPVPRQPM